MSQTKKKTLKERNKHHEDNANLKDINKVLGEVDEISMKNLKGKSKLSR